MKLLTECVFCKNTKFVFLFEGSDKMHPVSGTFSVVQCENCGLIFLNPQPDREELTKHYPQTYCSLTGAGRPNLEIFLHETYFAKGNWLRKLLLLPLKPKARSTKIVAGGRFLDVGCGTGYFLATMSQHNMECHGVEPGSFDKKLAAEKGLKIFNGELQEAHYPDNHFDVITMNHVFEHVHNPEETLRELHRILKPRGTLILAVPESRSLAYRFFGKNWMSLDIPRHLFTYTSRILKSWACKSGFQYQKSRFNSVPAQFLGSLLYWSNRFRKKTEISL